MPLPKLEISVLNALRHQRFGTGAGVGTLRRKFPRAQRLAASEVWHDNPAGCCRLVPVQRAQRLAASEVWHRRMRRLYLLSAASAQRLAASEVWHRVFVAHTVIRIELSAQRLAASEVWHPLFNSYFELTN